MGITISQDLVGRLVKVEPGSNGSFIITLAIQNNPPKTGYETYRVSVKAEELANSYYKLGLDSENFQKLKNGEALDPTVLKNMELSAVILRAKLDSISSRKIKTGTNSILNATRIDVETNMESVREPDEIYYQQSNGRPAPWPGQDKIPPFIPIPVPEKGLMLGSNKVRIGYAVFNSPIHFVEHTRTTNLSQIPSMRQSGTLKKGTGQAYESFNISYMAHGPEEITKGVQEVFEQIALMPFTSAEGGPFGSLDEIGEIPYHAIAVRNFSISTVDGLPNTVQVDISFDPFNWEFFTPVTEGIFPRYQFDDMICWPLVKVWAKTRQRSRYSGQKFNGRLSLAFPNLEASRQLQELFSLDPYPSTASDVESLDTLLNQSKKTDGITSRNAKEILHPTGAQTGVRWFVLKLSDPKIYKEFVPQVADRDDSRVTNGNEGVYFAGLIDWSKLNSANFVDDDGNFLPSSATVNVDYITRAFSTGRPLQPDQRQSDINDSLSVADIKRPGLGNKTIDQQITDLMLTKYGFLTVPGTGDPRYSEYINTVLPDIQNRQKQPWNYYGILLRTNKGNISKFQNHVSKVKNDYRRENQYRYDSFGTQVEQIFSATDATTVVLDAGPGGDDFSSIVVERVSGARGHNLALTSQRGDPLPLHSYMGGIDATFVVEGKCFGIDAKQRLEAVKHEFDHRAIFKQSQKYLIETSDVRRSESTGSAFLRIENELFQLLGVEFVLPITLTFQSVDGQPNVWSYTITFLEYDPKQKQAEEMQFLPTTWDSIGRVYEYGFNDGTNNPILDKGLEYFSLQASLAKEETYPDMSLPTQGEFDFWITALKRGSALWNPKSNTDIYRDAKDKKNLSDEEKAICRLVADQFFPIYSDKIKKLFTATQGTNSQKESKAYVEPDFYCWYDPDHTFGNVFDLLSEHLMGPGPQSDAKGNPKNKDGYTLAAPGRDDSVTDPTKEPLAPYREYDPNYGVTTVYSHKYWAGNPERVSVEKELVEAREKYSYPLKRADQARKTVTEYETKLDQTEGAWWPELKDKSISFVDPKSKNVRITDADQSQYALGFVTDAPLNAQYTPDQGEKPYYADAVFSDTGKYFQMNWRQDQVMKAAQQLVDRPLTSSRFSGFGANNHFWASNEGVLRNDGTSTYQFVDTDELASDGITAIEKAIRQTNDYFGLPASEFDKKYNIAPDTGDGTGINTGVTAIQVHIPSPLAFNFSGPAFLNKVAIINSNFRYIEATGSNTTFTFSTAEDAIRKNWDYVDVIGNRYKVDPNVIRAVFMKRDGFGQFDPAGSLEDGFGDLDIDATGGFKNRDATTAVNNIDLFAKTYKSYLDYLNNVPTLALIATNMVLTTAARRQYWDPDTKKLRLEVLNDLKSMASAIAVSRYSTGSTRLLATAVKKYWTAANVIDEYYTGYISLCRVYGTYWNEDILGRQFDSYFFPLNPIILLDAENNEGAILTNFTPSGSEASIGQSRTAVDVLPHDLQDTEYDLNTGSLELAAEQAKKHRAALDPSSEGAIYGSLVDMREHSPFGRLAGAFPTFQIVLVNEGFYWASGNKKLWDQFYTRTGVASIEVHRTRHMPGGTATVTFSNMFYNITAYAQMEAMAHELALKEHERVKNFIQRPWVAISDIWNDLIVKNVPKDVIEAWKRCHLKRVALGAGTRLQIRMGYGSNPSKLPIVFNGTVIDAPVSEGYVTLTAVSDGHELEKPSTQKLVKSGNAFAFQDGGIVGTGKDPSSIVTESIVGATIWDNVFQGNFRDFSLGIAHFGETYFEGLRHYPAEVQINIYAARQTRLEQGISAVQNYNIINAVTNWDNEKNLFSVEVQEPTPWKVMEVCRRACLDFVASAETFAMRSTVFFGKWWWPYHYTYAPAITNLGKLRDVFVGAGYIGGGLDDELKRQENVNRITKKMPATIVVKTPEITDATFNKVYTGQYKDFARKVYSKAKQDRPTTSIANITFTRTETRKDIVDSTRQVARDHQYDYGPDTPQQARQRDQYYNTPPKDIIDETYYWFKVIWMDGTWSDYNISKNDKIQYVKDGNNQPMKVEPFEDVSGGQTINPPADRTPTDFLKDVENLVGYLKWKPFMQSYIAHSGINLLDNNIRADNTKVYTDATGLHLYNGWISGDSVSKTITYSVDTDIHPGDRKTMMVETGILLTGLQGGLNSIAGGITTAASYIPLVGGLFEGGRKYIEETPTTPAIENAVVSALVDSVKEMYQGWFTIMGQPTVKPRDLFLLTDHITDLKGPVFVKEVIQRMDANTGYITMVSPDACVLPHSSIIGQQLIVSLSCGILHRLGGFMITKMAAAGAWAAFNGKINRKINAQVSSDYSKYRKLQQVYDGQSAQASQQLFDKLDQDLTTRLATLRDAGKADTTEYKKLSQVYSRLHNTLDHNSTPAQIVEFAKRNGITIDVKGLNIHGGDLIAKQIAFEADLEIERQKMIDDIVRGKSLAGLDKDEALGAVDKYINNKRAGWVASNATEVDNILKVSVSNADVVQLQKRARELLSAKQQGLIAKASGKGLTDAELSGIDKELSAVIKRLQVAVDAGDIPHIELDRALRRLINSPVSRWVDNSLVEGFRGAFRAAVDTPKTLVKGILGVITETKAAAMTWANRVAISKHPTSKIGTYIRLYKQARLIGQDTEEAVKAAKVIKRLAKIKVANLMRVASEIGTGVRILKYMGPQAVISLAIDATIWIVGGSLIEGYNARLRARQSVKIIPLMAGTIPYTAGIRGHQGAVIGDSPSWADELISGLHGAGNILPGWMTGFLGVSSALIGIELPEYGITEVDQKWINKVREEEASKGNG